MAQGTLSTTDDLEDPFLDQYECQLPQHPSPLGSHPLELVRYYTPPLTQVHEEPVQPALIRSVGEEISPQASRPPISGFDGIVDKEADKPASYGKSTFWTKRCKVLIVILIFVVLGTIAGVLIACWRITKSRDHHNPQSVNSTSTQISTWTHTDITTAREPTTVRVSLSTVEALTTIKETASMLMTIHTNDQTSTLITESIVSKVVTGVSVQTSIVTESITLSLRPVPPPLPLPSPHSTHGTTMVKSGGISNENSSANSEVTQSPPPTTLQTSRSATTIETTTRVPPQGTKRIVKHQILHANLNNLTATLYSHPGMNGMQPSKLIHDKQSTDRSVKSESRTTVPD